MENDELIPLNFKPACEDCDEPCKECDARVDMVAELGLPAVIFLGAGECGHGFCFGRGETGRLADLLAHVLKTDPQMRDILIESLRLAK